MIAGHTMKVNGKWYPAGSEVPVGNKPETDSETKARKGRPPKSDSESESK